MGQVGLSYTLVKVFNVPKFKILRQVLDASRLLCPPTYFCADSNCVIVMLSVGKIPHKVVVGLEPNLDTTLGHNEDFLVGFDDLFLHFTAYVQDTWWWLGSGVNLEFL